jgi:hypothetical protein
MVLGDCRVHTQSTRTGYSPAHTAKANCRSKKIGIVGHFGCTRSGICTQTLLKGNGEDVKVVQELMRHASISVTLNIYGQAITQTKRNAQRRVVSLLLDKNEQKLSTEAYRTLREVQNSGGDLQVVDKVGVPINDIFEHLDATIEEATPLYELCASVLRSAAPLLRLQNPNNELARSMLCDS